MYTIGTAALRYIRDHVDPSLKPYFYVDSAGTVERLVAFVGTLADLKGDIDYFTLFGMAWPPAQSPAPAINVSAYSLVFIVPAVDENPNGGAYHQIKNPISQAVLWVPCKHEGSVLDFFALDPDAFGAVAGTIPQALLANLVRSAGGYMDALYKIQRGLLTDINSAVRSDGLLYWSKDTKELYIYDHYYVTPTSSGWYPITVTIPVGTLWTWPTSIAPGNGQPPAHWIRADGAWVPKNTYPLLWQAIGDQFLGTDTPDPNQFKLPEQSNMIIRYE